MNRITPQESLDRLSSSQQQGMALAPGKNKKKSPTFVRAIDENVYLFEQGKGGFVTPAYDEITPLLGEYDEGVDMPPALDEWLKVYAAEMEWYANESLVEDEPEDGWMVDRIMYISSWCEYGEFAGSSSAPNGLSWRGVSANYTFTLTPAKWLYPRIGNDSGNYPASASGDVRVRAGQPFTYRTFALSSDSWLSVRGINYYLDIGDMNVALSASQGSFSISGKRLQKFVVNPNGTDANAMLASGFIVTNAVNIKELTIRNVSTASGAFDITKCTRLETINLEGTGFNNVQVPASDKLTTLRLPATLQTITLVAQPSLTTVSFEGTDYLNEVTIDQEMVGALATQPVIASIYASRGVSNPMSILNVYNIEWTNVVADFLAWCAKASTSNLTGTIDMKIASQDRYMTLDEVLLCVDKWGNIQTGGGGLAVDYPKRNITSIALKGEKYIFKPNRGDWDGTFPFIFDGWSLDVSPANGNDVKIDSNDKPVINFSISSGYSDYADIVDSYKGILSVKQLQQALLDAPFTLTISLTKTDDTVITIQNNVGFYKRIPRLGDFAYLDGTFNNVYDKTKGLAGVVTDCQKILDDGVDNGTRQVKVLAKANISARNTAGTYTMPSTVMWGAIEASNYTPATWTTDVQRAIGRSPYDAGTPRCSQSTINMNNDTTYIDVSTETGYKVVTDTMFTRMDGKGNTDKIVALAKAIITTDWESSTYGNGPQANEPTNLYELMDILKEWIDVRTAAGDTSVETRWQTIFFLPAYTCRLYEPVSEVGGEIAEQYTVGHWYLPSTGELARVLNFHYNSKGRVNSNAVSATYANETPSCEALTPIFSNVLKRMIDAGLTTTTAQPFKIMESRNYHSSNETNAQYYGLANFNNTNMSNTRKDYSNVMRAMTEFTFTL